MEGKGLLSGVRVIDCGTYIAGPASATVMSDFGAEVIKIESPAGDLWRLFSRLPGAARSDSIGAGFSPTATRRASRSISQIPQAATRCSGW